MKFRKFAARLFGFSTPKPTPAPRLPADPLRQAYEDACIILARMYTGEPWSRRALSGTLSQPRWATAITLLRSAGILDAKGKRTALDYDISTAEAILREIVRREREKRRNPRYVSPLG